ncbi:bifunctional 5,10-methylenetetrahydrofolate dehydrogenase/5,10-methenyltetrahydrofolate cyclohydrolase [Clostridium isatidis]|uniref:Bifunctional protein FolD n=1 Tax=Clostridium isatidis TaxID=182773 RepID=A0A343JAY1_9CLOT|nr:tetrahydrofolate dehydrogenase/cyclohydrolase catalytic domain-containing protein [Clostridium isatidis]ASW42689.1 bifunctional methylenetetrahydrofolate dehydrogenase/methenyltetrahydrofolate cyclohydrolase [Clostridium isatidis]
MDNIIDGRLIASKIKEEIREFVRLRKENNKREPMITSILIGKDEGSIYYINSQEKIALSLGCKFKKILLEEDIEEEHLINIIEELNNDEEVDGIIVQLPLPQRLNEKKIVNTISPKKDIDCLTYINQGKLFAGEGEIIPCTPKSVLSLLEKSDVNLEGKNVTVIGRSNIVGKPVAQLMLSKNATVTICHSKTQTLKEITRKADIVIVAIGKPKFLTKEYVKEGAIVIDVGTSSLNGKITGDVDFEEVSKIAKLITKVPGGVGALTTTLLIKNACEALERNENENTNCNGVK